MNFDHSDYENYEQEQPQGKPVSPFADSFYEVEAEVKPKVKKQKKPCNIKWKKILACGIAVAVVAALSCGITAAAMKEYYEEKLEDYTESVENKIQALENKYQNSGVSGGGEILADGELTPSQVYQQNVDAVVAISNQGLTTNFYGQVSETASSGSGFIVSEDGFVVTNYHVVSGAKSLEVILYNGTSYEAKLMGYDDTNDLAVLKIDGTGLPHVSLGSSDALGIGDRVAAIGNPLGELTSTMTIGYISAKDRMVSTDGTPISMMQTDAAINSGNSGGPLFNMYGQVVGITTAKYSGTSNSGATIEGIGFAIPIDDVKSMITDIMEKGYISGAYLGVMVRDMNEEVAETYGFPMGVYVDSVIDGYCAKEAGIQAKDIITAVGDNQVTSMSELTKALRQFEPGDQTTVTVYRSGADLTLEITLDEKPKQELEEETVPEQQQQQQQIPGGSFEDFFNYFFNFGG